MIDFEALFLKDFIYTNYTYTYHSGEYIHIDRLVFRSSCLIIIGVQNLYHVMVRIVNWFFELFPEKLKSLESSSLIGNFSFLMQLSLYVLLLNKSLNLGMEFNNCNAELTKHKFLSDFTPVLIFSLKGAILFLQFLVTDLKILDE